MQYSTTPEIIGEPSLKLDGELNLSKIEKRQDWEYAINLNQIDGPFEPSEKLKELMEKEINGEIKSDEIVKILVKKYTVKKEL